MHTTTESTSSSPATPVEFSLPLPFQSALAIEYAQGWLSRQGEGLLSFQRHPEVSPSGVIQRALQVYMAHLDSADLNLEASFVDDVCNHRAMPGADQQAASQRLQSAFMEPKPVPFEDVLDGLGTQAEWARIREEAQRLQDPFAI